MYVKARGRVGTVSAEFMGALNAKLSTGPGAGMGMMMGMMGVPRPMPKKVEDEPEQKIEVDYSNSQKNEEMGNKLNGILA